MYYNLKLSQLIITTTITLLLGSHIFNDDLSSLIVFTVSFGSVGTIDMPFTVTNNVDYLFHTVKQS